MRASSFADLVEAEIIQPTPLSSSPPSSLVFTAPPELRTSGALHPIVDQEISVVDILQTYNSKYTKSL